MSEGLLHQIDGNSRSPVRFHFDGALVTGFADDTVLAALLRNGTLIGESEFDGTPRVGFCLMGSCQECTIWDENGRRLRACMVDVRAGMVLRSTPYTTEPNDG